MIYDEYATTISNECIFSDTIPKEEDLAEFNENCPKCGCYKKMSYYKIITKDNSDGYDYLHTVCQECGYISYTHCLDWK